MVMFILMQIGGNGSYYYFWAFLLMISSFSHLVKQDPVLILDLASNAHASSFWMVHQQRKRSAVQFRLFVNYV